MMRKLPAPRAKLYQALTTPCFKCGAIGWVCEAHPQKPVAHEGCGWAGIPCRCNPEAVVGWNDDWAD